MTTRMNGCLIAAVFLAFAAKPVAAQTPAPYFQGKTIKVINNDPGGTAGLRVKTVLNTLRKYIPGAPTLIMEFVEGSGGRRAANQVFQNAKPDGLTIGALSSSIIGLQVMKETGVMYDIDKFIYLGTPVSENHNVIYTRGELGLNSIDKLRNAAGIKLGAQEVGGAAYISSRLFAYFLDIKSPKFVTGYSSLEADVALKNGEIDSRANNLTSVLTRNREWIDKGVMNFHAFIAVPKDDKPSHPLIAQLPEIESFARTERERRLLTLWRGFRTVAAPFVLPPNTPKERVEILQEAMRKTFRDPEFRAEFKKIVQDDASPLMPEELTKIIQTLPREAELIELLRKISGTDALPAR